MKVHQYINPHRLSNTYVLELNNNKVVLIDVGNFDTKPFLNWLKENNKTLSHVILTHEHADHCCGVDQLAENLSFQLILTAKCEENIRNSRQNFSYYLEDIDTFEIKHNNFIVVNDNQVITIEGYSFTFLETPGHSPGGMCIITQDNLFSGDTILNNKKTPLTFPHSNRKEYKQSIEKINQKLNSGMMIYPGHDNCFLFENFDKIFV